MITAVSISTTNIDDVELACEELKSQIAGKISLKKNTIGIIQCDPEFIEEGILEPLHKVLNFPLVGGTTVSAATNDQINRFIFSVMILTGDEVFFKASYTTGLYDDCFGAIDRSFKAAFEESEKPLQMVLIFPTVTDNAEVPGDVYVEAVEQVCGTVPVFGTLSVNDSIENYERSRSIYNNCAYSRELSYVLIYGDIKPRFFVAKTPKKSVLSSDSAGAVVTKIDGNNAVAEINNIPAVKYFESIEFATTGSLSKAMYFLPILVTTRDADGSARKYVRALLGFDENGYATCRGKIPVGSKISFASLNAADILSTTADLVKEINQEENINVVIFFSCLIRQLSIGTDPLKELAVIKDGIRKDIPFIASYSGGEISPVGHGPEDRPLNCFHNYSLIACVL